MFEWNFFRLSSDWNWGKQTNKQITQSHTHTQKCVSIFLMVRWFFRLLSLFRFCFLQTKIHLWNAGIWTHKAIVETKNDADENIENFEGCLSWIKNIFGKNANKKNYAVLVFNSWVKKTKNDFTNLQCQNDNIFWGKMRLFFDSCFYGVSFQNQKSNEKKRKTGLD